jgi:hypothetical protein
LSYLTGLVMWLEVEFRVVLRQPGFGFRVYASVFRVWDLGFGVGC